MPIGFYRIHRNIDATTARGALPQVPESQDPLDVALLKIVDAQGKQLLRYDIRPQELAPAPGFTLAGKDRVSNKQVIQTRTAAIITPSDARLNGQQAIEFPGGPNPQSDLRVDAPPPSSFTGFVAAAIAPSLKATPTTAHLLCLTKGSTIFGYLRLLSTGAILFGNSVSAAASASIPVANVPAGDVPFLIHFIMNRAANKVKIGINGITTAEGTPTAPFDPDPTVKMGIGSAAGQSSGFGWIGPISRMPILEGELSAAQIASVAGAMRTKYGIP